ncbi:MAG TPA: hypothetical protein VG916_12115, partial [Gemmatimonadaceae bacterium]|nr:hypothetical protein [Gemmatimonadaceae bacterium]
MPLVQLLRRMPALAILAAAPFALHAQQKRPLTQADWDRWETIASPTLSPDGKWAAYTLNPRVGDGTFVVRSTGAATEYRVDLGFTNRENNTPGALRGRGGAPAGGGGGRGGRGGGGPSGAGPFSADGKFAFVVVSNAPKAKVDSAEAAQRAAGRGAPGGRGAANGANALNQVNQAAQALHVIRLADGNADVIRGA